MNTLIMELLREIATSDIITLAFKEYSLSLRPRVRKADNTKKKKGFPTSKAEI